jgi:hypothetical protein
LFAGVELDLGEMHFQAVFVLPAAPVAAFGAGVKYTFERIGPWSLALFALLSAGGVYLYKRQSVERRQHVREIAMGVGLFLLEEAGKASAETEKAHQKLAALAVPAPEERSPEAVVLRELATASDSLSAQQLSDRLDLPPGTSVKVIREFLRAQDGKMLSQVRRGGYVVGRQCRITVPAA